MDRPAGLREMGMDADYSEANPFAEDPDPILARYTPLRRVSVLEHGGVVLMETAAILRYLDHISDAPRWSHRRQRQLHRSGR